MSNQDKYTKSGPKATGKKKGITTVHIGDLIERVQESNMNLSYFVRDKLEEYFRAQDEESQKKQAS